MEPRIGIKDLSLMTPATDAAQPPSPQSRSPVREFSGTVAADSLKQLEEAAMAAAREFFGPDIPLAVVRDYSAARNGDPSLTGKFAAYITVRETPAGELPSRP